jgi:hypothetical protein
MNNELEPGKHYRDLTSDLMMCVEEVTVLSKAEMVVNLLYVMS